jgi:Putative peptidoglycan binding domain
MKRLQRILVMLKLLDYRGIDGIFSSNTENAVKDFQESGHLARDGIVGPTPGEHCPSIRSRRFFSPCAPIKASVECRGRGRP